jgi:hypothetical protein
MCGSSFPPGKVPKRGPVVGIASVSWRAFDLCRHRGVCLLRTHDAMKLNVQRRFAGLEIAALAIRLRRYECAFKLGRVHGRHLVSEFLSEYNPQQLAGNKTGIPCQQ